MAIKIEDIIEHLDLTPPPKEIAALPFGEGVWPWMGAARKKLQKTAPEELSLLSIEAYRSLEKSLAMRLSSISLPSLQMEMGVKKLQEELEGNDSRERFLDFVKQIACDREGLLEFFAEYKLLGSAICSILGFWVDQSVEFLLRLKKDLKELNFAFNEGVSLGKVETLFQNAGDVHNCGRSVIILSFTSGKKLVYKPKDLSITKAFHELLEKLNNLQLSPPLKGYKVLVKEDYGWEEMVEQRPAESIEDIERFYERTGMLLALFYLLEGSDAHLENLIAAKEHPHIIDLETLFHPHLKIPDQDASIQIYGHSVLITGIIPMFDIGLKGARGADISALGQGEEQNVTYPVWHNINTDAMELKEVSDKVANKYPCRLIYQGKTVLAKEYLPFIVKGFEKIYLLVQRKKKELENWLEDLKSIPVRYIFRATKFYGLLLERIFHPQVHLNEELVKKELSLLDRAAEKEMSNLLPLIEEEKKNLLENDVPFFRSYIGSTHIYKKNDILVKDCLEKSPMENVRKILENLSDQDRNLQVKYILQAFESKEAILHEKTNKNPLKWIEGQVEEEKIWDAVLCVASKLKTWPLYLARGV